MRRAILALLVVPWFAAAAPAPRDPLRLEVVYTSDIHGHIDRGRATFMNPEFPPPLGGGASFAAYVGRLRRETAAGRVLVFDSGDMFQGTPLGAHTRGGAVIEWMNRMGYTAATLGNHDFDLGRENAERLAGLARFPILAGNLFDSTTGRRLSWVRGSEVIEVEGIRIAILGYITESTVHMAYARNIAGIEFRPVVEVLPGDVAQARRDGADLVLVLLHHGLPYRLDVETSYRQMMEREAAGTLRRPGMDAMEIAHIAEGVDAIFGGHTHQGYDRPWEDPRTHALVFEPYGNGSSLGHVTLEIDRGTRRLVGYDTHFDRGALLTLMEDEFWPDTTESRILEAQVAEAEAGLDVELGRASAPIASGPATNSPLGFLVTDALREELAADVALLNTGGLRGSLPSGPLTERELLGVLPFGNHMLIADLPGALFRDLIEDKLVGRAGGIFASGIRVRYDLSRPEGSRLTELTVGGVAINTTRSYRVALSDYLAEGNSGMARLRAVPPEAFLPSGFTDRELFSRYLSRVRVIRPLDDGRWKEGAAQ